MVSKCGHGRTNNGCIDCTIGFADNILETLKVVGELKSIAPDLISDIESCLKTLHIGGEADEYVEDESPSDECLTLAVFNPEQQIDSEMLPNRISSNALVPHHNPGDEPSSQLVNSSEIISLLQPVMQNRMKWSHEEQILLVRGVNREGRSWERIRSLYPQLAKFSGVQLKDKYRLLEKKAPYN